MFTNGEIEGIFSLNFLFDSIILSANIVCFEAVHSAFPYIASNRKIHVTDIQLYYSISIHNINNNNNEEACRRKRKESLLVLNMKMK